MLLAVGLLCSLAFASPAWKPSDKQVPVFNTGIDAFNARRWDAAIAAFRKVVNAEPECGLALFMLGSSLADSGRTAEAIEPLLAVNAAFPGRADVGVKLADALFVAQRFEEAADAAHTALKLEPASPEALVMAVRADVRLNRTEAALATLDGLQGVQQDASLACQRILVLQNAHRDAEANGLLAACLKSSRPDEIAEAQGRLSAEEGEKAADVLGAASLSRSVRAARLIQGGQYVEAESLLRELLAENPDDAVARVNRAHCLYLMGRKGEAQKELQRLFSAGTWVRREDNGSISGVLTARSADELEVVLRESLASLVEVLIEGGDSAAAQEAQTRAEQRFGRAGSLIATQADLEFSSGLPGWSTLSPVLLGGDPGDLAWKVVSEQAFSHPADVPGAVGALIIQQGPDVAKFNLAAGRANTGDYDGCLAAVGAIGDRATPAAVNLGYRCAIRAADEPTLGAWRERAKRAGGVHFADAYDDALRAANQPDWGGTLLRLNLAAPEGDEEVAAANDLTVAALTGLGRLDEALKAAAAPGVDPVSVYNLGVALQHAGREDEALALVKRACVGAEGELKSRCATALPP